MGRGVYHAKQKALAHTVDRSQGINPAAAKQGKCGNASKPTPAAGKSLAKDQAPRLGQSLIRKKKEAAEAAPFILNQLKLRPAALLASF